MTRLPRIAVACVARAEPAADLPSPGPAPAASGTAEPCASFKDFVATACPLTWHNGTMAGGGDTEDTRWDQAIKYRLAYGPVHFGAMYKFADGSGGCYSAASTWSAATCTPEQAHNTAYGFDLGAEAFNFSIDAVFQHYNQAISVLNPLPGPQSLAQPYQSTTNSINTNPISGNNVIGTNNTEYGIVTDNTAIMLAAKYTWNQFNFYAGYEHIQQFNPSTPLGVGAST
jgi:predicted porin